MKHIFTLYNGINEWEYPLFQTDTFEQAIEFAEDLATRMRETITAFNSFEVTENLRIDVAKANFKRFVDKHDSLKWSESNPMRPFGMPPKGKKQEYEQLRKKMLKSYPIDSPLLGRGLRDAMTDKEWSNILVGAIKQHEINVMEI